jgi:hypothetical protein
MMLVKNTDNGKFDKIKIQNIVLSGLSTGREI